ncbi:MAG: hypothetical protein COZ05_16775, partial [Armatimonadetes bacterium CG_4_10_14_3_um_filter_59_10]
MENAFPGRLPRRHAALLLCSLLSACVGDGQALFAQTGCLECHSVNGHGGRMGPDLTAVSGRLSFWQIRNYVRNPVRQNPRARMPIIRDLAEPQLWAIIHYL